MPSPRAAAFEPALLWQRCANPLFWLDPACRLVWVNQAWEQLTGYSADSVVGLVCQAHGPGKEPDAGDLVSSFFPPPEALAGRPIRTSALIVHSDGRRFWRQVTFWPFPDKVSGQVGILGSIEPDQHASDIPTSESARDILQLQRLRERLYANHGFDSLIGSGSSYERLLAQVQLAAASSLPLLIVGEAGSGKRHVARAIHQQSEARQRPLIAFDCAALSPEILERDLFETHSFNFHSESNDPLKPNLRVPPGSTLLLVEILHLPRDLQTRILPCLGSGVRLIATTSSQPEPAVARHQLRSDLYCALTALIIPLAPLRDRRDELPILAQALLERANKRGGGACRAISSEAIEVLMRYDWPGNLAELARVIEHARLAAARQIEPRPLGGSIRPVDLPAAIQGHLGAAYTPPLPSRPIKPLDELLLEVEQRLIETALKQSRSNKSRAAEILGISRPRLYRRIKELGLPDDEAPDHS